MAGFASKMTDARSRRQPVFHIDQYNADYIKVVESDTALEVRTQAGMWLVLEGEQAGQEADRNRIIETRSARMKPNTTAIAVWLHGLCAKGSVKKGENLSRRAIPLLRQNHACVACHGNGPARIGPCHRSRPFTELHRAPAL